MIENDRIRFELSAIYNNVIDSSIYIKNDEKLTMRCEDGSFYKMLLYSDEEFKDILDYSFVRCIYAPDKSLFLHKINNYEEAFNIDIRLMNKKADVIWYRIAVIKNTDSEDEFFCILCDISEVKDTEMEYTKQSRFMELIQTSIEGGTSICFDDKKMSVAYIGKDFLNFLGYTYDEFMANCQGSLLNMVYEQDREEVRDIIDSWFKSGDYYEVEFRIRKKDGTVTWVLDKGNRIKNENGDNILVSLIMDINNTRQIIAKLEEANNDLKSMQNSIPGSFGKIALEEDGIKIISANSRLYEFFDEYGMDSRKSKYMTYNFFEINQPLINEIAIRREDNIEFEYENKKNHKWYMLRASYADELYDGKYPVYYMMISDITTQKESQFQSEVQKEKYEKIIEITDDIVFEYDCIADVMVYSEKYKEIFNKNRIVFNFRNVMSGYDEGESGYINFDEVFNALFAGNQIYRCEKNVMINSESDIWLELTAKGITNESGDIVKIIGLLRDIDRQKREQQKLYDRSRIDLLSQLLNKISTQEEIVSKIAMIQPGMYVGLIMMDIDDFKSVNDVYGHSTGDMVIKKIADLLKKNFRKYDVIGRVGGDEFQILMTNIFDPDIIEEKCENVCKEIEELFNGTSLEGKVTVSIGVYYTGAKVSYDVLYKKADVALYKAKSGGKNRYEVYGKDNENEDRYLAAAQTNDGEPKDIISNHFLINLSKLLTGNYPKEEDFIKALSYVGNELNIDRIVINLIDYKSNTYSMIHEWYKDGLWSVIRKMQNRPLEEYNIFNINENVSKAFYAEDKNMYSPLQRRFFSKSNFSAIIQSPVVMEGKTVAYIEYISVTEGRVFTNHELNCLTNVSVIIRNCIISMLQYNRLKSSMVNILNVILDGFDSCVHIRLMDGKYKRYVIDNGELCVVEEGDNYFETRMNQEILMALPKYKALVSEKLSRKSLESLADSLKKVVTIEYEISNLGKNSKIRKAILANKSKYDASDYAFITSYNISNEKNSSIDNDKNVISQEGILDMIECVYDEIIEVNMQDSTVKGIFLNNDMAKYCIEGTIYDEMLDVVVSETVHKDDRKYVLSNLSFDVIVNHFKNSQENIRTYFRRKDKNGIYIWSCLEIAKKYGKEDNKFFMMLYQMHDSACDCHNSGELIHGNGMLNNKILMEKAKYDNLTGIYTQEAFFEAADRFIKDDTKNKIAIIRMDLDKFKLINDLYGYETGDDVLKLTAQVIQSVVSGRGVYGRINSDIFCFCMRFSERDEIINIIEKIKSRLSIHNNKYRIAPFFGICVVEDKSVAVSTLCDWANIALKKIKGSQIVSYSFYDNHMRKTLLDERKFEGEMEHALESGQFEAYLQPQYDIETSKVISAEALIRWNHPEEGIISPGRFIPLFERNGFILRVDEFMWREACKNLRSWINKGYKPVPISVNVSRMHMFDDNLSDKLVNLLNEYNLPRHLLVLEVTETVYYDDSEAMNRTLNKLRNMGFQIAMDDFGSGYSSLNMLENMNVDELKIDRAFLSRAGATDNGKVIVQFIIAMAKKLNLRVVAEGVENVEQAAMLLEFGCNIAQGYYYSRPVPIDKFISQAFDENNKKEVPWQVMEVLNRKKESGGIHE